MPHIYLRSPDGGTKVATMEQEAQADERRGWVRYDPHVVSPTPNPVAVPETQKRRGRPPKSA